MPEVENKRDMKQATQLPNYTDDKSKWLGTQLEQEHYTDDKSRWLGTQLEQEHAGEANERHEQKTTINKKGTKPSDPMYQKNTDNEIMASARKMNIQSDTKQNDKTNSNDQSDPTNNVSSQHKGQSQGQSSMTDTTDGNSVNSSKWHASINVELSENFQNSARHNRWWGTLFAHQMPNHHIQYKYTEHKELHQYAGMFNNWGKQFQAVYSEKP